MIDNVIVISASTDPAASDLLFEFDGVLVSFSSSSQDVLDALKCMLRPATQAASESANKLHIESIRGERWLISVGETPAEWLPIISAAPLVARRMVDTACVAAAQRQQSLLFRGALLEKNGRGIALIGRDLDAVKALALHLHSRRWGVVSFEYAFMNRSTLDITGLQCLASINSKAIDFIPSSYRRALEASPWYDAGDHLTFYGVDPYLVHATHSLSTTLECILNVDFNGDARVASTGGIRTCPEDVDSHPMAKSVRIGNVAFAAPIPSCDAVESWFAIGNAISAG